MTTLEVGKKLVELCSIGQNAKAIETLYSPDIVSVEAMSMPNMPAEMRGIAAIVGKNKWWIENHEVHFASCAGPYPHGDRFIVNFKCDITNKPSGHRMQMDEIGLFTVQNGKVTSEEFLYVTG